jgi:hypothetical protein
VAFNPPHHQGQSVPSKPEVRLGFGFIRSPGRVVPLPATREILVQLDAIARRASTTVKGLEPLLTDAELASLFKVDQRTIRRWVQRGWIGYIDMGDGKKQLRRYPLSWVKTLIEARSHRSDVDPKTFLTT